MLCYAKSLQSCPTLCDHIDGSPPGSPVLGILQARTLTRAGEVVYAITILCIKSCNLQSQLSVHLQFLKRE